MLELIKNSSIFGIAITLAVFLISSRIYSRVKISLLHPMIVSQVVLIVLLLYLNMGYQEYLASGGSIISFLLGPATIALAVPLFKQWERLKANALPIALGVIAGSLTGMLSAFLLSKLFGLEELIVLSLLPKSVTSPIAIDLSNLVGGIPSLTILGTITAGTIGAIFGPKLLKLFGVREEIAQGIAMGAASHGIGTARALEEGEVQGAMSGLSVGLTGLTTALIIPFLTQLLMGWM